jgi:hypothetical protein
MVNLNTAAQQVPSVDLSAVRYPTAPAKSEAEKLWDLSARPDFFTVLNAMRQASE